MKDWQLYSEIDENGEFTHLEEKKEDTRLEHQKSIDDMLETELIYEVDRYKDVYAEYWRYC